MADFDLSIARLKVSLLGMQAEHAHHYARLAAMLEAMHHHLEGRR